MVLKTLKVVHSTRNSVAPVSRKKCNALKNAVGRQEPDHQEPPPFSRKHVTRFKDAVRGKDERRQDDNEVSEEVEERDTGRTKVRRSRSKSRSRSMSRKARNREALEKRVGALRAYKGHLGVEEEDTCMATDDAKYNCNRCSFLPTTEELLEMNDNFADLFKRKRKRHRNVHR